MKRCRSWRAVCDLLYALYGSVVRCVLHTLTHKHTHSIRAKVSTSAWDVCGIRLKEAREASPILVALFVVLVTETATVEYCHLAFSLNQLPVQSAHNTHLYALSLFYTHV